MSAGEERVTQDMIDRWRGRYGLNLLAPAAAARWWSDRCNGSAPAAAVEALGIALAEIDLLRADLQRHEELDHARLEHEKRSRRAAAARVDRAIQEALDDGMMKRDPRQERAE